MSAPVFAQDSGATDVALDSTIDTVIVTGTRDAARTQFDSLTPIDVISADALDVSVSSELVDSLAQIIPSFSVQRLPSANGSQFVRPARLRGLSSDQTLVLVNGKRLHRSAALGMRGEQAPDLALIPSSAIKRVEVLRDGASAQYGSDAIAGVINVILDDSTGFDAFTKYSQYYAGDGAEVQIGVRGGWSIGDEGHVVATLEYADSDETSRTRQRPDAIAFQQAHPELNVPNPVQIWGQPGLETYRAAIDATLPFGDASEAYVFGTYSQGEGVNDFNWRNPDNTGSAYNPSSVFPGFNLRNLYPTGYTPRFGQEHKDHQLNAGARGSSSDALRWDVQASNGYNKIEYFINNTINPSLGPQSPTSFRPGNLIQDEVNLNADFVYRWDVGALDDDINVAFGAERRVETYEIEAGDYASYAVGPGAATGLASGSNGFAGFSPEQAGEWDQQSYAFYTDIEVPVTQRWTLGSAIRYEDFSEFGDKVTGRLATRFELTPALGLRASVSTGFRAPTPAQLFSTSVSQGLDTRTLQIFATGRLSPSSPVAQFFGAKPLKPETSETISAGLTWRLDSGFSGSFDVYQIEVADRFSQSSTFTVTPAIRQQLIAAGVPGAETFTGVSFFTNDFDTRTRGVDLVASYSLPVARGRLQLTGSYNFNDTEVTSGSLAASESQRVVFEENIPQHNATGSATYGVGPFKLVGRMRYYGKWTDASGNTTGDLFQEFGGITLFDAMLGYDVTANVMVALGAENIFDEYPDEATNQANRGLIYSRNAPYDTDGGQYLLAIGHKILTARDGGNAGNAWSNCQRRESHGKPAQPPGEADMTTISRRDLLATGIVAAVASPTIAASSKLPARPNVPAEQLATNESYWRDVAAQYDITRDVIQLENGNWGSMSLPVLAAYERNLQRVNRENSYYARREFIEDQQKIRARIASTLGVSVDEIALTRNATEALQALIGGYNRLRPGDAVLFADLDYDAMQDAMRWLKERRGVDVMTIALPEPATYQSIIDAYAVALKNHPKVRLMLLTHLTHRTGLIVPVKEIVALARQRNVDVIVDSAHAWGQIDFRLNELDVDFVGLNAHKWIGAPLGVGIMYVRRSRVRDIDPFMGDESFPAGDIRNRVHPGTSNFAAYLTVPDALDFHEAIGTPAKEARLRYLRDQWAEAVRGREEWEILTPTDKRLYAGITSFRRRGQTDVKYNMRLAERLLDEAKIFTVRRAGLASGSCVRVTPSVFTSLDDIQQLRKTLEGVAARW